MTSPRCSPCFVLRSAEAIPPQARCCRASPYDAGGRGRPRAAGRLDPRPVPAGTRERVPPMTPFLTVAASTRATEQSLPRVRARRQSSRSPGITTPVVLSADRDRRAVHDPQPGKPDLAGVHPVDARPHLRPQGPPARRQRRRRSRSRSDRRTSRISGATTSSTGLAALLEMDPADINGAIDRNPGSRFDLVRIATDVPDATARVHRGGRARPARRLGHVEARRRLPLRAPRVAAPRLHRARSPADQRRPQGRGLPAGRPDRQGRSRGARTRPSCAGTYGSERSSGTRRVARSRSCGPYQPAVPGDSLELTIDVEIQRTPRRRCSGP